MPKESKAKTRKKESESSEAPEEEPKAEPSKSKPQVEDRLDHFADRFSRAMSDGVKKMEDAFEKGMNNIKSNPKFQEGRLRGFFTSSSGGAILVIVGVVWFAYAVGLLSNWIIPLLIIALGAYLMHRYKSD
ncbi:MAG: hypothetical protein O7D32_02740 [bacterium]|nr:hypothetical protein [bacterium]